MDKKIRDDIISLHQQYTKLAKELKTSTTELLFTVMSRELIILNETVKANAKARE